MGSHVDREALARRFARVRARTAALVAPLSAEDAMVQSQPDASPTKWHLAHTTWFFQEFLLARVTVDYGWPDERWRVIFNSYYEAVGPRHERAARGVLSRPTLSEVCAWRAQVDERVLSVLPRLGAQALATLLLGTHHEEQHQELILTDIKHAFSCSELRPAYRADGPSPFRPAERSALPLSWLAAGDAKAPVTVGACAGLGSQDGAFAFDNETPAHRRWVEPFELASRLVTNAEYAVFVEDGGYARPELWLSEGWAAVQAGGWTRPLYWEGGPGERRVFGMYGVEPLYPSAPVTHVSLYEADAYARWAGARLPTEGEWESVAQRGDVQGNFLDSGRLEACQACGACAGAHPDQLFGDAWEWTASAYLPYPRFRPLEGTLGEYNAKFMSGQMVLRGGSCFSPREHLRATYRNFFPPAARWQVTGIRLARDA